MRIIIEIDGNGTSVQTQTSGSNGAMTMTKDAIDGGAPPASLTQDIESASGQFVASESDGARLSDGAQDIGGPPPSLVRAIENGTAPAASDAASPTKKGAGKN